MKQAVAPNENMAVRDVAAVTIYPAQGQQHAAAKDLSALAAYTRSLLRALPEQERRRQVVLTNIKQEEPAHYLDDDIAVREVWRKGSLLYAWQLIQFIRRHPSLRIIHLQHEFNQFGSAKTVPLIPVLLGVLRFLMGRKVVVTLHEVLGNEILTPELVKKFCLPVPSRPARILFKWYYRIVCACCDTVLVQHEKFRKRLREEIGSRAHIEILPIGTETDVALADRETSRAKYQLNPDDKALLFFGTIDWRKGLDVLIKAFNQLDGNYRLLIGGGLPVRIRHLPAFKDWYNELEAMMQANPNVRHLGFIDDTDMPALFAASDLVVLPYVVPQMVSAVLNHAASYERPFIGSLAFKGHADDLVLCEAEPDELAAKIVWATEHQKELLTYARSYKNEMSWTNTATLLSRYYALMITP